jgi:predicted SAM-dependent methyltransferase
VSGLEPDPKAAEVARQRGVEVTVGTVDMLTSDANCFDVITLSHVIEHVHEPKQLLQAVHRLLKPGGMVYIDTPNIQSNGAALFKENWRGLETPRHLVLFNTTNLTGLLSAIGFADTKFERCTRVIQGMYLSSLRIEAGHSPYGTEPTKLSFMQRIRLLFTFTPTDQLEFVTLTARKVSS